MTDLWHEILELARHTPSPHNVQPWKFRITGHTQAMLFIDLSRTLPAEDTTGSFILSAMTMMLQSLEYLAANRGYKLQADIIYKNMNEALSPFASLTLISDPSVNSVYDDSLFLKRRTSRLSHHRKKIPAAAIEVLKTKVESAGHAFSYTASQPVIKKLLSYDINALFHDLNEPGYYTEIESYFRYSDQHSLSHGDGLDYRCMNLPAYEYWLVGKCPWLLKIPVLKNIFYHLYRYRLGHVETIGWISGRFWKPQDALAAGRTLIKFWLEAAALDLYIHPLGNLVTNKQAAEKVADEVDAQNIWLIFKIGYTDLPPKSHRLELKELLID